MKIRKRQKTEFIHFQLLITPNSIKKTRITRGPQTTAKAADTEKLLQLPLIVLQKKFCLKIP